MKELTPLLEQLAEKLGTTTEYLWGVLINQARVEAYSNIAYILSVLIAGVFIYMLHKSFRKDKCYGDGYDITPCSFVIIIISIIWLFFALAIPYILNETITALANPEYWALKEVIKAIN